MDNKLNVAISIAIGTDPQQSIWVNGGNQNCVYLYLLLKQSPLIGEVWLVHDDGVQSVPKGLHMGEHEQALRPISQVIGQTDLLIEMGTQVAPEHIQGVRQRGGKCVSYRFGNDYVITVEIINFNSIEWKPNTTRNQFDELWTNPQHAHTCKSYFEALYRAPVQVLPHIWSPYFIERTLDANPALKAKWGYRNHGPAKRVAMFEPNLNVVKSALIPILACNEVYLRRPDLLKHVYMTNTFRLKENSAFKHIALGLKMVLDNKATAEGRFPFVDFASDYTDVVISHQWENGLNYLFYDALYGGYPLVHNSPFLRDVGYYYADFEVFDAAIALQRALEMHDMQAADYAIKARGFLQTVDALSPHNVDAYSQRIAALFAR
ncbi:MAG: DUF2827 family protein [Betaproteobacteria bacterium]|nr:DUF2827 family protein [Betaproteobacteria bacterium]